MNNKNSQVELLSPAGDLETAYCAFANGADAIYLGLKRFSARAGAVNFSKEEVLEIVSYAKTHAPNKKVFVAINTLIKEDEISELIDWLGFLEISGIDAVIVQDLGVFYLIKEFFPKLALHASTQMAVHNSAGCRVLKNLGFERVVLARELTLEEIKDAVKQDVEIEVFIHGALCYCYSGLCLFSAMAYGHSANRGSCVYPCREFFSSDKNEGYLFSMKDLALLDDVKKLRDIGVASLKIEGRKRSKNYAATVTELYRKILDGGISNEEKENLIAKAKISFGRKWTNLYLNSSSNQDIIDKNIAGHLGVEAGSVIKFFKKRNVGYVKFKSLIDFEKYDVLKIEQTKDYKVFSFPVSDVFLNQKGNYKKIFEVKAGQVVEVALPKDCPFIEENSKIFCASSQSLKKDITVSKIDKKQTYFYDLKVHLKILQDKLDAKVCIKFLSGEFLNVSFAEKHDFEKTQKDCNNEIEKAFNKFGNTNFSVSEVKLYNDNYFVPLSVVKDFRRNLVEELEKNINARISKKQQDVKEAIFSENKKEYDKSLKKIGVFNDYNFLVNFSDELKDFYEIVVGVDDLEIEKIKKIYGIYGDRLRLLMPVICRNDDYLLLKNKVKELLSLGFKNWEITGLWCFDILNVEPDRNAVDKKGLNITSAWSLYVMNSLSAKALYDMGISRWTLSLEYDENNMKQIVAKYPNYSILTIFHQTAFFVSANDVFEKRDCKNVKSKKNLSFYAKNQENYFELIPKEKFVCNKSATELLKLGINLIKFDFSYSCLKNKDILKIIKTNDI